MGRKLEILKDTAQQATYGLFYQHSLLGHWSEKQIVCLLLNSLLKTSRPSPLRQKRKEKGLASRRQTVITTPMRMLKNIIGTWLNYKEGDTGFVIFLCVWKDGGRQSFNEDIFLSGKFSCPKWEHSRKWSWLLLRADQFFYPIRRPEDLLL